MNKLLPKLKIGDLIAKIPIIQGGMGVGISMSGLASAVANAGGIGVISTVGLGAMRPVSGKNYPEANTQMLKEEIQNARKLSKGIIGLNIMVALSNFDDMLKTAFEENIDIIFMGAGLALKLPESITNEYLQKAKTKIGMIVSSARATKLLIQHWAEKFSRVPDVIVVEGPKAGGHLGFKPEQIDDPNFALEKLVPEIKAEITPLEEKYNQKIALVAGGGIYTGADIKKIMDLGADGVQMGTRFVATHECDADIAFKESYISCKKEDIGIIKSPVGLPGRAIINQFLTDVSNGVKKPFTCPWKCLKTCDFRTAPYCIAQALLNSQKGKLADGFAFAGANAWMVDKIVSVQELVDQLQAEYAECFA